MSDVLPRVQASQGVALWRFIACCHHASYDRVPIRRLHTAAFLPFSRTNHLHLRSDSSTCGQQGSPHSRRFQIPEPVACSRVAVLVERTLLGGQRAEQPIEQKEADAKVPVHQSRIIQHSVMDIVQPSAALKPAFEYRIAFHPEIL